MPRKPRRIVIANRTWRLETDADLGDRWGDCSDPAAPRRRIRVSKRAKGLWFIEILIHELIHARWWALCESEVTEFAAELTAVLALFREEILEAMNADD